MPAPSRSSLALTLAAIVVLAVNLRSPIIAFGPLVDVIRHDLGLSGAQIGLVAALPMLGFALCSPLAGRLARRWGIEAVLAGSAAVLLMGLVLRSAWPGMSALILGTLVMAAAISMGNVLLPALTKRVMPQHIGLGIGCLSATMAISSGVAGGISMPLAQWLGWRAALAAWALPCLLALTVWLVMANGSRHQAASASRHGEVPAAVNMWREPAAWLVSLFMGVQSLAFYALINFMPAVLSAAGLSPVAAGQYILLMQWASLAGVFGASWVGGRMSGLQIPTLCAALVSLAGCVGLWLAAEQAPALWAACLGIGTTGLFAMAMILFVRRTAGVADAAALSGMAQTVGYSMAILGPLGMGWLFDLHGSWWLPMAVLSVVMALECVLAWFASSNRVIGSKS